MEVTIAQTEEEMKGVQHVRYEVFVKEQHVSVEEEWDEYEDSSIHFLAHDNHTPVGAGRLRWVENTGKAERICILSSYRGTGLGRLIMSALEDYVQSQNGKEVILSAQTHARPFYEKIGYKVTSEEEFLDAGIPHVSMIKGIE
ncbi:GNAT family N-acetyltransferase [Geomicrobium sp. JCM 19039]|uniref:GNAT family N-acetyltransferase n=1 Tax=Geomicrobium sp. JCM 19039 TaxID=1460636 RepID=UPI00045F335A|nr:GNAT family N-acetyltransferase [Geomicrobium sp. JCM 19039]GAK11884.1 GNAT family acetyltransferase YjcF [Geomicrobium sp. JCM 19039]